MDEAGSDVVVQKLTGPTSSGIGKTDLGKAGKSARDPLEVDESRESVKRWDG